MSDVAYVLVWVTLVGFSVIASVMTVRCFLLTDRNRDLKQRLRESQGENRMLHDELRQRDMEDSIARDARHLHQHCTRDLPLFPKDIVGETEL